MEVLGEMQYETQLEGLSGWLGYRGLALQNEVRSAHTQQTKSNL